jgi:hypothetical protein
MFDWPSIVDYFVPRCAAIQSDGNPRFAGNFAFASDASLDAMMETQLRNCCAFRRNRGGKISFVGEESKTSVFTFSQTNMVSGSLKLNKKDLRLAPNIYVPQFRDLNLPAIVEVQSCVTTGAPVDNAGSFSSGPTSLFTTVGPQPFDPSDLAIYGGSSDDAAFAGLYGGNGGTPIDLNGVVQDVISAIPNQFPAIGGPVAGGTATGGYLGSYSTYFKQRAPEVVQHRAHQKAVAQVGPGILPIARQNKVFYDLGNNTFFQTNRIMKFMMARDLGTDGPGWLARSLAASPDGLRRSTLTVNRCTKSNPATWSRSTAPLPSSSGLDLRSTQAVFTEWSIRWTPNTPPAPPTRTLSLQTYNLDANPVTIVPDAPGASFASIPGFCLSLADVMPSDTPFWLLQCTPQAAYSGSTLTITVPDCTIQWLGQTAPTVYPVVLALRHPCQRAAVCLPGRHRHGHHADLGTRHRFSVSQLSCESHAGPTAGAAYTSSLRPHRPVLRRVHPRRHLRGGSGAGVVTGSAIPSGSSAAVPVPPGTGSGEAVVFTPYAGFAGQACFYGYDPSIYVPASGATSYAGTPGFPTPVGPITEGP